MSEVFGEPTLLLILGVLFLIGLAADLIGRSTFLPRVTLLLLSGLAIGPAGFSMLPEIFLQQWFPTLTTIALALIGFLLGHQLSVSALKERGAMVVGISLCKVVGAWIAVVLSLLLIGVDPIVALLLAGIAPATAPAATYDVVHESGVVSEFSETLLSVVAVDDVWGLLIFIVMMALAGVLGGDTAVSSGIVESLFEIGGSVLLGIALGVPMAYLTGRVRRGEPTLVEAMGFVLLAAGVAGSLDLYPILSAMAMGITVASLAKHHDRPFHAIEGIEWPFMVLFFVLAGASLDVEALPLVGWLATTYIIARCIGIYIGSRSGGRLMGANQKLRRWLGLALFPQGGVAIGMALLASQRFPELASIVLPVVLTSTIIFEIVAPVITRRALRAVGQEESSGQSR